MGNRKINKLVILGGGTAGWISAAAFARLLGRGIEIELIESDAIGTVGVGEATIPQIIRLNTILGFDEWEFIKNTQATFKLGIEFVDWLAPGASYLHTFGDPGINLAGVSFHHYWLRHAMAGGAEDLWHYSLHQYAAQQQKFGHIARVGNTQMTGLAYAYHLDANLYAQYLRKHAQANGVKRQEGRVTQVERDGENGDIASLKLDNGISIKGDFFIDCTGFRSILLGQELGVDLADWSHWLCCDRAWALPSAALTNPPPFTRATARKAGWQWQIPLQHRIGNGHVFSSAFIDEEEAAEQLLSNLQTEAIGDPRLIKFTTGIRKEFWSHNCVAIGLASGFLEPLESTSIHLIQSNINRLIELFPRSGVSDAARQEYNAKTTREFEQIRDFLILHYHLNKRDDSEFWRYCRNMQVPDTLQNKLDLFASTGRIGRDPDDLFREASWTQVMLGQGIMPSDYNPMADSLEAGQLRSFMGDVRQLIEQTINRLPNHAEYIAQHGKAAT